MTGPEHYREAEKLLAAADIAIGQFEEHGWEAKRQVAENLTAQAQAHATLALTAASVLPGLSDIDWRQWRAALTPPKPKPEDDDG